MKSKSYYVKQAGLATSLLMTAAAGIYFPSPYIYPLPLYATAACSWLILSDSLVQLEN